MTKSEFNHAMQRGLGRCIPALKENPDRYRGLVLWACKHNLSFDTQCEGTRAWYVYQMICCFANRTRFADIVIEALSLQKSDGSWDILYFSELLAYFIRDGYEPAEQALWGKYKEFYEILLQKEEVPDGVFSARDDFEELCNLLSYNFENYCRIAENIGTLYMENPIYDGFDFESLWQNHEKEDNIRLAAVAEQSLYITAYIDEQKQREREARDRGKAQRAPLNTITGKILSRSLAHEPEETINFYAEAYINESDPVKRTEKLFAFSICPFPFEPAPVLEDAESSNPELKEAALTALEQICHPAVRAYAIKLTEREPKCALPILARNYCPEDAKLLSDLLENFTIDSEEFSGWHSAHMAILDILDRLDGAESPPISLLPQIYESTLCSCCRKRTFFLMVKYHMLSEDVLAECVYDCNEDIRKYANMIINGR